MSVCHDLALSIGGFFFGGGVVATYYRLRGYRVKKP